MPIGMSSSGRISDSGLRRIDVSSRSSPRSGRPLIASSQPTLPLDQKLSNDLSAHHSHVGCAHPYKLKKSATSRFTRQE